jgi:cytochrome c oxidase subunit 4
METRTKEPAAHITPVRVYLTVGLALFLLTALTVKVSLIHLGTWNAIAALAIASLKGLLVALFFMHLLYDKKIYMVVVSVALIILGILIGLTMADILRRGDIYEYQAHPIKPEARIYDAARGDTAGVHEHDAAGNESETTPQESDSHH